MDEAQSLKRAKFTLIALSVLVVLGVGGFRHAGRWLTVDDPLSHADAIFILSGGLPYRAEEAGRVYAMGYASEVWVSRPDSPVAKLEKLGIHFVGEEEYNREILIHAGVPESAIHILPAIVINTEEDVEEAARRSMPIIGGETHATFLPSCAKLLD